MVETKRYIVKGKVQGVGFRYFVYRTAHKMEIMGRVRNLGDGSVEITASATSHRCFLEKIKKGNFFCRVEEIKEVESNMSCLYVDFKIV